MENKPSYQVISMSELYWSIFWSAFTMDGEWWNVIERVQNENGEYSQYTYRSESGNLLTVIDLSVK